MDLTCATEGCQDVAAGETWPEAMAAAVAAGWTRTSRPGSDRWYCPEHLTLPSCENCGRPMRPWGRPAKDFPGSMASGRKGLCASCSSGSGPAGADIERAGERYRHNRGFDALANLADEEARAELASLYLARRGATDLLDVLGLS